MSDDDRSGKPKSGAQVASELCGLLDTKREQMTANMFRLLARERGRCTTSGEFKDFAAGIVMVLSEIDETMGGWARDCVRTEQQMHEAHS